VHRLSRSMLNKELNRIANCVILAQGDSKQPDSAKAGLTNLKVINHCITSSADLPVFSVPTSRLLG